MAAPIISWRNEDNTAEAAAWEVGTVDAGTQSEEFTVLIWNNFQGNADVSTMTNCTITTKDTAGGNTGQVVSGKWASVKIPSANEVVFTPIGGVTTHPIIASGNTVNEDGTHAPEVQQILGVKNDGDMNNSKGNYCKATLKLDVPGTAAAGYSPFLVRVSFQYI